MSDPASFANLDNVKITSFHLDLSVNFKEKTLKGHIDVKAKALKESTSLVLDTRDLTISKVEDLKGNKIEHSMDKPHPVFGSKLEVKFGEAVKEGETKDIRIYYSTSPQSSAIQWLPPANTAGKKHPYLFTQCQAIHARSMFPCQDSPGVKSTYTATIAVPSPLVALMSAVAAKGTGEKKEDSVVYRFSQPVPTPSYLVALVVGCLEERKIGPRSSVWSEPEMVDAGVAEFEDTEKYLATAESIAGPYSLATVVIHEISHSWMGNLVTCKSWVDFWMNEGFCRILELKIIKALFGDKYFDLYANIGLKALRGSISLFGEDHNYTKMRPELKDVDPDDAFSSVPYEKGLNFLIYLENLIGGEKVMNPLLKEYCSTFKNDVVTAEKFRDFFLSYLKGKVDDKVLGGIEWEKWWYTTGMPYKANKFDTSLMDECVEAASKCKEGVIVEGSVVKGWSTAQTVIFLDKLEDIQMEDFKAAEKGGEQKEKAKFQELLSGLDKKCGFSKSRNSEILFRWYKLGIRSGLESVFPDAIKFVLSQGRMKFVRPLYRLLFASPEGKEKALETFKANKDIYHSIAAKMIAKDLKLSS